MIYVTGDIHADLDRFKGKEAKKLKKGDTLIVCGDFGFVWDGSKKEQQVLKWIGKRPYQVLFIEGTHDNLSLLDTYPLVDFCGGRARQIIGVDGSPRMLELSRRRLAGVEGEPEGVSLRIGELSHLPLRDCEADFASINMVLHHLSNPENALAEIRRVLRSGGLLVVADFDRHTQERMRLDYGDLWLGFDEATMARLLHAASFEVVSTTRYPVEQGLALNLTLARRL